MGKRASKGIPHSPPLSSTPKASPVPGQSRSWLPGVTMYGMAAATGSICCMKLSHCVEKPLHGRGEGEWGGVRVCGCVWVGGWVCPQTKCQVIPHALWVLV